MFTKQFFPILQTAKPKENKIPKNEMKFNFIKKKKKLI